MAHYRQTTGFDGIVRSDFQTALDNLFGSAASQAPGRVHDGRQEYDLNLKVTYEDLWFQGWYSNKNREPFLGGGLSLNDESDLEDNYVFGEVGYKKTLEERFTLRPRAYYDQFDSNSKFEAFPENTIFPTDINNDGTEELTIYPDGQIFIVKGIERIVGTKVPLDYTLFDGNIITLGLEYRLINQSDNHFLANFDQVTGAPLPDIEDFSDTFSFLPDITRRIFSVYLQDTWDITDTLNLTLGVRHDRYNDFGNATSPRAGLTWAFLKNASLKLLYGEAFRAPSFYEMFQIGIGNKDLDPEKIRTYEVGLSYQFNKYVTSSVNYFYNDIKDLIALQRDISGSSRFENLTNAHVQGIEMETKVDISASNYIFMNYTFQNPEDNEGNDLPFVAQHKGNFGINVHHWKYINTNISTFVSGRRSRIDTDPRDDLPAYALLNFSIIGREFFKTMEVQGTVFNILDKDYSDPGPTRIPDDLPRPGRTFFVGLSYQL
ncbi:MAG: TonB-dependent receptor [Candidatus Brocadia sp.]|nr:TonB-dependent receptor [Candidatus Brocadia sp.]UJS16868.1 MAG: TonB-dependent receptor [Candidatus Jettenia sp.]